MKMMSVYSTPKIGSAFRLACNSSDILLKKANHRHGEIIPPCGRPFDTE